MKRLKFTASLLLKAVAVAAICLSTLSPARALTNNAANPPVFDAGGKLNSVKIDYGFVEAGRKGMRMTVDFEVSGLKGVDTKLLVRVLNDEEYLKNTSSFAGKDDDIDVSYSIRPGFDTAVYDEVVLFMPYDEFGLDDGDWDLRLDFDLAYEDGRVIAHLAYRDFKFSPPGKAREAAISPTGKINKVWLEQDVVENKRRGMRLHLNFETKGLKDVDSSILVRIMRQNDTFVLRGPTLGNSDGQFEASYEMKPRYDPAVFEDASIFIPYDEVVLRKGVWRLKFDIDLNYADGTLVRHLAFHEFTLTK